MGTMIQRLKLDEAAFRGARFGDHGKPVQGNNDLLVLSQPQAIAKIHADYLAAGADIICTNTFNAQGISLADYDMRALAHEINYVAALTRPRRRRRRPARQRRAPAVVAGALGPTNRTASISPDVNNPGFRNVSFDELVDAYSEQVRGLDRRRRRSTADRDRVRHSQCQGGGLCGAAQLRGTRCRVAIDHLRHHHGSFRPHPIGGRPPPPSSTPCAT